jgi:2-polyprenyl-3-methyl-5-hydroxy-6-metoxy-1,4-benzoquinol methylase
MRHLFLSGLALALLWFSTAPDFALADEKHPVSGRKIADVMGAGGAAWLTRPERSEEENPDLAVSLLGLEPGMTVADIGAGVGYFSVKMARKVGPDGIVYATDIQPKMLEYLEAYARQNQVENIRAVLSEPDDPKLPAGTIDLVLLVDVYHEFSHPSEMLQGIRRALKPDGRVVLLEYRKEDPDLPIKEDHKMSVKMVKKELEPEGFQFDELITSLPRQHILIFKKKPN